VAHNNKQRSAERTCGKAPELQASLCIVAKQHMPRPAPNLSPVSQVVSNLISTHAEGCSHISDNTAQAPSNDTGQWCIPTRVGLCWCALHGPPSLHS
jgi:hypothetical protein